MKRIIASTISLIIMIIVFSGCIGNTDSEDSVASESTASETTTVGTAEDVNDESEWVNENNITLSTSDMEFSLFYIPTPDNVCAVAGGSKAAPQFDDTFIVFGGQDFSDTNVVENVESVFPSYFSKVQLALNDYFYATYDEDCTFEIAEQKTMTVNGYEMCRYSGSMVYNDREDDVESNYVAYAVKLKEIDCYAYWFVMDISDDLSADDTVAYNADYISKHIHE